MVRTERAIPGRRRIPGEAGIWVLIGGELVAFSAFFLIFTYYRGLGPALFRQGQAHLDHGIGLANTLILLTSSLFVAIGAGRMRDGRAGAALWLRLGLGCGALFAVLKLVEYGRKIGAGITPFTNDYFLYYFAFTGIHLGHVLVGSAALAYALGLTRQAPSASRTMIVECIAIFWHLVDLLWIMLFALFYLAAGHG